MKSSPLELRMDEVSKRWRELADTLEPYAPAAAEAWRRAALELAAEVGAYLNEPLTPEEAEAEGLCQAESVRKAAREGRAENIGTATRIRVRRKDVPRGKGAGSASLGINRAARTAAIRRGL